jgi:hypothetical protein
MRQFSLSNEDLRKKIKVLMLSVIALILLILLSIALYVVWGFYQIESSFSAKQQQIVQASLEAGNVAEIGYICDSRTVTCIKNRTKRLYWWVKIPTTKKRYLCEWQYGFSGMRKDDPVTLIHQVDGTDWSPGLTGYIIGMQGQIKDRPSCVSLLGVDETDY